MRCASREKMRICWSPAERLFSVSIITTSSSSPPHHRLRQPGDAGMGRLLNMLGFTVWRGG